MTDFRILCVELTDDLEEWVDGYLINDPADQHTAASFELINRARAALAESDGPDVPDDRDPASVVDQLKRQLLHRAKADLIRQVIDRALRDTASVHWRVTDTGEQIVRVRDLMTWAEQTADRMEALPE